MIEMSSGLGATAMGIGVSHGNNGGGGGVGVSGGGGVGGGGGGGGGIVVEGCRLRTQSQASQLQQVAANNPQQTTPQNRQSELLQNSREGQQQEHSRTGPGGRSKKDNCCLCWCCCCSCSCLAAVGTGNGGTGGVGNDSGKKKGNIGGIGGVELIGSSGGNQTGSSAGNGLDNLDGIDGSTPECCGLEEVRSWGSSFDKLMRSSAGRKVFRDFLISEYSEENIAFWLACEQLKRESNAEKIEEKARYIYEDYISILSPKEVSLDSRVREIVNRNMVEPTPHTFDEAQLQIYTLMHRDSYPRFINSDIFRRVARLGSEPPTPTIEDPTAPVVKTKSKKSIT